MATLEPPKVVNLTEGAVLGKKDGEPYGYTDSELADKVAGTGTLVTADALDADTAALVADSGSATRAALDQQFVTVDSVVEGVVDATDPTVKALVEDAESDTRGALDAEYRVTVNHGDNADTARPATTAPVVWIGSVQPSNFVSGDVVVIDTSGKTRHDVAVKSSADSTINTTSWAEIADTTVTVDAEVGDIVLFTVNGKWAGSGDDGHGRLNIYSVGLGTNLQSGDNGIVSLSGPAGVEMPVGAAVTFAIQSGMLDENGQAEFHLVGRVVTGSTTRILKSNNSDRLRFSALVL